MNSLSINNILISIALFFSSINFFQPSALIFREFGIFPSVLLLNTFALLNFRSSLNFKVSKSFLNFLIIFIIGLMIGICHILIDGIMSYGGKNNLHQLYFQSLLLLDTIFVSYVLSFYFSKKNNLNFFFSIIPYALIFNLAFFYYDFYFNFPEIITKLTNNDSRPSGLSSEPSFYQAYIAILALAIINLKINKFFKFIIFILSIISCIISGEQTFYFILFLFFLIYIVFNLKISNYIKSFIFIFMILLSIFSVYVFFDFIPDNQESFLMRFGSSLTAINIFLSNLLGIGIGQFHFYFNDIYVPKRLLHFNEALFFLREESLIKAHVFNYYTRLLIEFSPVALFIFLKTIFKEIYCKLYIRSDQSLNILYFFVSSAIFMMSIDLFSYPLQIFSFGLIFLKIPLK
jgi:hypothetical protein